MVHFWRVFEILKLAVSFNRTKIGGKCQNGKNQMQHFEYFSNNVLLEEEEPKIKNCVLRFVFCFVVVIGMERWQSIFHFPRKWISNLTSSSFLSFKRCHKEEFCVVRISVRNKYLVLNMKQKKRQASSSNLLFCGLSTRNFSGLLATKKMHMWAGVILRLFVNCHTDLNLP